MKYNVTVRKAKDGKLIDKQENISFEKMMHVLNKWYTKYDGKKLDESTMRVFEMEGAKGILMGGGSKLGVSIDHAK